MVIVDGLNIDNAINESVYIGKLIGIHSCLSSHSFSTSSHPPPPSLPPSHQRANSESNIHGPYMRGSASSFKKLSKFFGEEPPRVEDIETFLEGLGYSHLYPVRARVISHKSSSTIDT